MTFLPQFKACIEAGAWSVMCSYNRYAAMSWEIISLAHLTDISQALSFSVLVC